MGKVEKSSGFFTYTATSRMMMAAVMLKVRNRSISSGGIGRIITNSIPTMPSGSARSITLLNMAVSVIPAIAYFLFLSLYT